MTESLITSAKIIRAKITRANKPSRFRTMLFIAALLIGAGSSLTLLRSAEAPHVIPAPEAIEQPAPGAPATEVAVLAGGCFWGVQGVFQHVDGVTNAVSGYAGGDKKTARDRVGGIRI
jgi:peptide-methionine (S)-S-oxide reductase